MPKPNRRPGRPVASLFPPLRLGARLGCLPGRSISDLRLVAYTSNGGRRNRHLRQRPTLAFDAARRTTSAVPPRSPQAGRRVRRVPLGGEGLNPSAASASPYMQGSNLTERTRSLVAA